MPGSILENPDSRIPPPQPHLPPLLRPRHATLRDGQTSVTLYPITNGPASVPRDLVRFLHREFSAEIERGCTYPMEEAMGEEKFAEYWFGTFAVVAVLTAATGVGAEGDDDEGLKEGRDWEKECLGTFYVKPNYPGRCSHICNAGFLTCTSSRGKGVGRVMGETYLEYAPKLGYKYSVFNLVFANNEASIRIWDGLGFGVIGRVPGAARLKNSEELVDALIYGRDLVG
ncbi:hypothetical protein VTN00DRAFT_4705 [Thermoascus crustaceus]|uniref:uncharacterized protein n=1 Tax=Thermoascus crustaceus TaxID=5088 RepID=UPI003744AD52